MQLRNVKPLDYNGQRRNKCKSKDTRESIAFVYVSEHTKQKEKLHLIIENVLFIPNGPNYGQEFVYFKCCKKYCNARAKISRQHLESMEQQNLTELNCPVLINNSHNHQTVARRQLRLGRGSQEEDSEREEDDLEENYDIEDNEQEDDLEENYEMAFVDTELAIQRSDTSVSSITDDPLKLASGPMQSKGDFSEQETHRSGNQVKYLNEMLDTHVLTDAEKQNFEKMAREARKLGTEPQNEDYLDKLLVSPCPKYGKCVTTTVEIPKGAYIGSFYGRLCRKLPEDAIYSFIISERKEKRLFVNAENIEDRPLLA